MKQFKVLVALVLAMTLAFSVAAASAQTIGTAAAGTGSITITNAALSETYKVFKLFDATLTNVPSTGDSTGIAYTGTIPDALSTYFTKDAAGNIQIAEKSEGVKYTDTEVTEAVQTWALALSETDTHYVTKATSDGTALEFVGLAYGYYIVTSSQGSLVTIDSLRPNATIHDKNTVTPNVVKKVNGKDLDDVHIGETVTFTATFGPLANYIGEEQVQSYTISDTLPAFLKNVAITEVKVWDKDPSATGASATDLSSSFTSFGTDKKITIQWVNDESTPVSKYNNKSYITIAYTAVIDENPVINSVGATEANVNTVTITPNKDKTGENPFNEHWSDDAEIKTYGTALIKVDENNNPLTGAEFTINGYEVELVETGVYKIVAEKNGASAVMTPGTDSVLYILGMDEDITVTETKAPDGYNKLANPFTLSKQTLTHEIWTEAGDKYFDAKGNLVSQSSSTTHTVTVSKNYTDLKPNAVKVVNNAGTELPSTGGIGTTIFYIVGAVLVLGAAAVILARRKAEQE